jgi:hypothetical protein
MHSQANERIEQSAARPEAPTTLLNDHLVTSSLSDYKLATNMGGGRDITSLGFSDLTIESGADKAGYPLEPYSNRWNKDTLHHKVDQFVDRDNPEYQQQKQAFEKYEHDHRMDANIMGPDMSRWPELEAHARRVQEREEAIKQAALNKLTEPEREKLAHEYKSYERQMATGTLLSTPKPGATLQKYFDLVKAETERETQ